MRDLPDLIVPICPPRQLPRCLPRSALARVVFAPVALAAGAILLVGCSTRDAAPGGGRDSSAASPPTVTARSAAGVTGVRGRLASVTDTALTVTSATGDVRVVLAPPVVVYARVPADLSQVTEHAFVGVTSVAQPDGSQRATEIHVFPEELRGTNEGSFLIVQQPDAAGGRSTMTNGTVAPSRMTNGTVDAQRGGTIRVQFRDSSQTIVVPPGVSVTAIAPTRTKLTPGANVVVLAVEQPDGALRSSAVLLASGSGSTK